MAKVLNEIGRRIALTDILADLEKDGYKPASLLRFAARAAWRVMGDLEAATVSAYLITVQPDDALRYGLIGAGGMMGAYLADYLIFEQLLPKINALGKKD
ncbi:MAG: hypothetical protein AABX64_01975 [Nanoarchaeota archaeon]